MKLGDQVPETFSFDVGYYEGQHHSKIWLFSDADLQAMYKSHSTGEITLWCDGRTPNHKKEGSKRKGDDCSMGPSKRQKMEDVDLVFKELKEKHGNSFDTPRLHLWARMVTNKIHEDLDSPPNILAFCSTPRRPRQQSLSSAITGAANALVKAFGDTTQESETSTCRQPGVSPGKAVDLRMKNYEQLRYVQQLFDDGILSEKEYMEQKQCILSSLRKL